MTYSPEDLVWIDRIVREWDSDRESELLGDLRRQIDQIPPRLLGVSTAPITSEFDAFYLAMLRRWAALGVLRHRAVESCDALIARYAPQVIEMALRLPDWAVDLPSPPAEVLTEADARRQFVGLLIPVNRALRVIWIQTHGQHSLPQLDDAPAVEGYERCAEPLLRRELYNFDQLKGVMQYNGDTTPLLESLFRFFSDLRDFFNAWVDYRISTFGAEAAGTLDGVLNASGAYYLADAVLHWRHNYPYLAGGLNGESLRIEWASRAGVFVDVTEWGSQRAQSADILWGIVEQLGGEDVRTSAVFQNSSRAADAVTSIATFFLDVRGVYNLVRGAGGAVGTATRIGTLPPGAVVGGGAAALAPYLARVAVVADEVPWATAAGAVSAIRAAILAFSAGGDGGNEEILSHSASFPENESQLRHIFAEREGHVIDTLENRTMIQNTVAEANYLGPDQYGNHWYAQIQSDGTQIWVRVRNGRIINAGVNQVPKSYHPETGLNAPLNW